MLPYLPFLLIFIGGSLLMIGDIVIKKWVDNNQTPMFFAGLGIWLVGLIFLAFSFKYKNIAVASTMFVVVNIITLSFVSWFYFHETLSAYQLVGIGFAILLIIFLELA